MTREEEINEAVNTYMNGLFEDGVEIPIEDFENIEEGFEAGAKWADSTYVKGDIEKESESYAQGVIGDISEDIRHLLATAYIAGAKRIMK